MKTKNKGLYKTAVEIMMKYHFDPYGKQRYIDNVARAIEKYVLEQIGEDEENPQGVGVIKIVNQVKQEIRQRLQGDNTMLNITEPIARIKEKK